MRELYLEITGIDVCEMNTTAAFCMRHFKTNHLKDSSTLALVGEKPYGHDKLFKQSEIARKYKKFIEINNLKLLDT